MEPRLSASVRVEAIKRLATQAGGFATVVARGDAVSGSVLVLGLVRGAEPALYEQMPAFDGNRPWQIIWDKDQEARKSGLDDYLARRRKTDPDLWVVELDVADAAQLSDILLQIA